jgi:hypothetical protein
MIEDQCDGYIEYVVENGKVYGIDVPVRSAERSSANLYWERIEKEAAEFEVTVDYYLAEFI